MDKASKTYGRPLVVSQFSTEQNGEDVNSKGICPAALGTKDQQPAAFSPKTGLFYVPTNHVCMDYEPFQVRYTAGQPYVGATLSMYPATEQPRRDGQLHRLGRPRGQDRVVAQGAVLGVVGRARDGRRRGLLRHARGLSEGGRLEDRQGALQVQDSVRHHRQRDHLHAQGQAVRRRPLRASAAGPASALRRASPNRPPVSARSAATRLSTTTPRSAAS